MRIAVDAVGGDFIPKSPVEGALEALAERPDLSIVFVGPEDLIAEELAKHDYDRDRVIVNMRLKSLKCMIHLLKLLKQNQILRCTSV